MPKATPQRRQRCERATVLRRRASTSAFSENWIHNRTNHHPSAFLRFSAKAAAATRSSRYDVSNALRSGIDVQSAIKSGHETRIGSSLPEAVRTPTKRSPARGPNLPGFQLTSGKARFSMIKSRSRSFGCLPLSSIKTPARAIECTCPPHKRICRQLWGAAEQRSAGNRRASSESFARNPHLFKSIRGHLPNGISSLQRQTGWCMRRIRSGWVVAATQRLILASWSGVSLPNALPKRPTLAMFELAMTNSISFSASTTTNGNRSNQSRPHLSAKTSGSSSQAKDDVNVFLQYTSLVIPNASRGSAHPARKPASDGHRMLNH